MSFKSTSMCGCTSWWTSDHKIEVGFAGHVLAIKRSPTTLSLHVSHTLQQRFHLLVFAPVFFHQLKSAAITYGTRASAHSRLSEWVTSGKHILHGFNHATLDAQCIWDANPKEVDALVATPLVSWEALRVFVQADQKSDALWIYTEFVVSVCSWNNQVHGCSAAYSLVIRYHAPGFVSFVVSGVLLPS